MWPVIIAEGLVLVRRAISIYNTLDTVFGSDKDEQDETLRGEVLEDEEIYFYLLAGGLFHHLSQKTGLAEATPKSVFRLVDGALISNIYQSAGGDVDNKCAAFCTAFGFELRAYGEDLTSALSRSIDQMKAQKELPFLLERILEDVTYINALKDHLKLQKYSSKSIDDVVKALKEKKNETSRYRKFITSVENGYLFFGDSWVSIIYSILSMGNNRHNFIYAGEEAGDIIFNTFQLPLWRPVDIGQAGKRPTYMERSITKADIDRAEKNMAEDKGLRWNAEKKEYIKVTETEPSAPEETPSGKKTAGKIVADLAKEQVKKWLMNKVLGSLSKFRFLQRSANVLEYEEEIEDVVVKE